VIVKEAETQKVAGSAHLYPADDPWLGQTFVMAPLLMKISKKDLTDAGLTDVDLTDPGRPQERNYLTTLKGARVHMLYNGQAYRRKI
jgi:hypothetical protein